MSDITQRLREQADDVLDAGYPYYGTPELVREAADHIDALAARLAAAERDAALGRIAMRFVDRAGDTCDEDPAETICAEFHLAMAEEVERQRKERSDIARDI